MRAGRGFTRGVEMEVELEVEERGGMAALTAGAVRVLQARGWDHRLTDHAIITSCMSRCRRRNRQSLPQVMRLSDGACLHTEVVKA